MESSVFSFLFPDGLWKEMLATMWIVQNNFTFTSKAGQKYLFYLEALRRSDILEDLESGKQENTEFFLT